jgi:hypothetical protein
MTDQDAIPFHLLFTNVEAWNQWRITEWTAKEVNFGSRFVGANRIFAGADLYRANLASAVLVRADFSRVVLQRAILTDADLTDANLCHSNLAAASLERAVLNRSDLRDASFLGANLTGASLQHARLRNALFRKTNLTRAKLRGADFEGVLIDECHFADVDLSEVQNLDKAVHVGPSSIGIDTLYRSRGLISERFLRDAGVPDQLITYMRSLTASPIEYYSCFISYSTANQDFADRLYADLRMSNVRCWLATEDLKIGDRFRNRIDESIRIHDKLLLVLSTHSIESTWVESEVEAAFEKERQQNTTVLFPIAVDDAVYNTEQAWASEIRRTRQIGNFADWKQHESYRKEITRLLRDLASA